MKECAEPCDVFGQLQTDRTDDDQEAGHRDDHLRMQRELAKAALAPNFHDDQKTDTAKDDQPCRHQIEQDIILIRDQVLQAAQHIKARVVERRHRMEQCDAKGIHGRIILHEYDEAEQGAHALKQQGQLQHRLDELDEPAVGAHVPGFLDQLPGLQADTFSRRQDQGDADACHAEPADLDQRRDHGPSEHSKVIGSVDGDQSRHTDGTG